VRRLRRSATPRITILDRVRARFGRRVERSAPEVFTARSSPPAFDTPPAERIVPTAVPSVRVHPDRVARKQARVALTPAQALELAEHGTESLQRRRPTAR
jgi:hypothetical protein